MVKCVGRPGRPWGSRSSRAGRPSLGHLGLVPYQYSCPPGSRMDISYESLMVGVSQFPWVCDCWTSRGVMWPQTTCWVYWCLSSRGEVNWAYKNFKQIQTFLKTEQKNRFILKRTNLFFSSLHQDCISAIWFSGIKSIYLWTKYHIDMHKWKQIAEPHTWMNLANQ